MGRWFLTKEDPSFPEKLSHTLSCLKGSLAPNKLEIRLPLIVGLFLVGYFSIELFMLLFILSLNVFANNPWSTSIYFFKYSYIIILEIKH
jgi:hypothetical protein